MLILDYSNLSIRISYLIKMQNMNKLNFIELYRSLPAINYCIQIMQGSCKSRSSLVSKNNKIREKNPKWDKNVPY